MTEPDDPHLIVLAVAAVVAGPILYGLILLAEHLFAGGR